MRDIKFKVWDKINNKMYDYGSDEACELLEEGVDFMGMSFLSCQPNVIWLQYTGLKDKNGKEIYEGDILEAENRLWQIGFRDGCFVGVDFKNVAWDELVNIGYGETKVIGNVFEDSELLEVV